MTATSGRRIIGRGGRPTFLRYSDIRGRVRTIEVDEYLNGLRKMEISIPNGLDYNSSRRY